MVNTARQVIDCRGMQCPAPILRIANAAKAAGGSQTVLEVLVDDHAFERDVTAWCRTSHSTLLTLEESAGVYRARIGLNGATESQVVQALGSAGTANDNQTETFIDCKGLRCPAPILQISKAAKALGAAGGTLRVEADDASFTPDLKAWLRTSGGELVSIEQCGPTVTAVVVFPGDGMQSSPRIAVRSEPEAPPTSQTAATLQVSAARRSAPRPDVVPHGVSAVPAPSPPPRPSRTTPVLQEEPVRSLDLRGLRAPEPIIKLSALLGQRPVGRWVIFADDPNFVAQIQLWSNLTQVALLGAHTTEGIVTAELEFGANVNSTAPRAIVPMQPVPVTAVEYADGGELSEAMLIVEDDVPVRHNRCTMFVMRNDFESLMAALMTATTAAAQGSEVAMFFSLWGVNVLRGERPRKDIESNGVSFLQRMMKWMMPKGPRRAKLSKMHMGGMGKGMMQYFMAKNNVMNIQQLLDSAVEQNVRFVVCTMSMGIMGIEKRDLMDLPNIEYAGMASFVELSQGSSSTFVF